MPQPVERQGRLFCQSRVLWCYTTLSRLRWPDGVPACAGTTGVGFLFGRGLGVSVSDIFAGIYYWLLDVKVARGDGKYELRIRKGGWWPWIPACAGRTGVGWGRGWPSPSPSLGGRSEVGPFPPCRGRGFLPGPSRGLAGFGGYGLTVSEGEKGPGVLLPPVIGNLQVLDQTFRRRAVFYRRFRDFGRQ